jgi:CubicO group peptidase (beta-lactamase class C family)
VCELESELDALAAETGFSGVVRVDLADRVVAAKAYGLAHRPYGIPNTVDTRFAIASGTKGLTALTVVSLIEDGRLELATPARSVLGDDLPLIPEDVTIEHLLAHRSGIGDYLDEESELDFDDYLMPVPVHELAATEQYLTALDGHEPKFPAGERFAYCNSGYVVLALIAERLTRVPFHELLRQRVCGPAGMDDTEFLRSDELPDRTAIGYLAAEGSRTNVFHLPVRGSGDGGIYTTVEDVARLWRAFFAGRVVSVEWVAEMVRPRSVLAKDARAYGLGFWLDTAAGSAVLTGSDAGVSFRTEYRSREDHITTLISNITHGTSSIARHLAERHQRRAP